MDFTTRYKSHHDSTALLKKAFTSNGNVKEYVTDLLTKQPKNPRTIYMHVPYCRKICSFCNMNRRHVNQTIKDYHRIIIESIKKISKHPYIQGKDFQSIYFGGGTPTTLSAVQIESILKALYDYLPISSGAEISVETSISELTDDRLIVMKENGVNRFSIGVQTFVDRGRDIFNRIGTGEKAIRRIEEVINMGFQNTNIDLIYNYPLQSMDELNYDLDIIKSLEIAGLSMYSLILHEGSSLQSEINKGNIVDPINLSREKEFFSTIYKRLKRENFKVLELTKMVRRDRDEYRYIKIKNRGGDCLALGLGAGGKLGNYIYYNGKIGMTIDENSAPISPMGRLVTKEYEIIDEIIGEMQFGRIKYKDVEERTNFQFQNYCSDFINELRAKDLININTEGFELNESGLFWGNNICRALTKHLMEIFQEDWEHNIKENCIV